MPGGVRRLEQGLHRLGHVALAPMRLAQPVAEFGRLVFAEGEADDADETAIEGDGVGPLVGALGDDLDKADAVGPRIGARQACQHLGDVAVVGEPHQVRHVAADGRAQHQPLGLDPAGQHVARRGVS